MVMTVLISDAKARREQIEQPDPNGRCLVSEMLYADDTLLAGIESDGVEEFMNLIGEAGAQYGLSFNWGKLEALPVRCAATIPIPGGQYVKEKDSIIYLGSLLSSDGRIGSELARRIGAATADFKSLCKVWGHSSITRKRKIQIFNACVVGRLLYCLHVAWLSIGELRRLDAFQAKCLRKITGIPHSYQSRVTNIEVRQTAGCSPLSSTLKERQLLLMGKIARKPADDTIRMCVFRPQTFEPRTVVARRQGRPRKTWTRELFRECVRIAGSEQALARLWQDSGQAQKEWKQKVKQHCFPN